MTGSLYVLGDILLEESLIKEFSGILYPEDKEASDYKYIYFILPEGYTSIEIEYDFDKEQGCIIDIGIFDPKNTFRGWSGSSKTKIYIGNMSATPGYISGEMPSGTWSIVLGLAKVVKFGCRYRVIVKMFKYVDMASNNKECTCVEKIKHRMNGGWIKGDLHTHTIHSDGKDDICNLILKAARLGLDYIAVTDHNTVSQITEIKTIKCSEILVIPGIEISTYYGHINTWGMKWFDFRRRDLDDFKKLIDEIHRENLLVSLNHPYNFDMNCIGCDFKYKGLRGFDSIEIWNGPTPVAWNAHAVNWWHNLLVEGLTIPVVGGSDYHGGSDIELATPTTWIYVNAITMENILNGIKRGRAFVSKTPSGPKIDMTIYNGNKWYSIGDRIDSLNKDLKVLIDVEVDKNTIDRYVDEIILRVITAKGVIKIYNIRRRLSKFMDTITVDGDTKFIRVEIGRYRDLYSLKPSEIIEFLTLSNPIYIP